MTSRTCQLSAQLSNYSSRADEAQSHSQFFGPIRMTNRLRRNTKGGSTVHFLRSDLRPVRKKLLEFAGNNRAALTNRRHLARLKALAAANSRLWKSQKFIDSSVDNLKCSPYTRLVVWLPLCWTGRPCSLTIDTMCQNPFETIRPYSSPNG